MPMVEYFDRALGQKKRKEFAYGGEGEVKAKNFEKEQRKIALSGGHQPPKRTKGGRIKPGTKSPAKSGHTPGAKGTGQTKPGDHHPPEMKKKPKKEVKYIDKDPFDFDKRSIVRYDGENY